MNINIMTRKDFEALPHRDWDKPLTFDSLIILPMRDMHDSGYRCMDFVAVRNDEPLCLLAGSSDVIHIDGIGGYGLNWLERYGTVPSQIPPSNWSIDCLPKSGLLRIFPGSGKMTCGGALSSFEIFALPKSD